MFHEKDIQGFMQIRDGVLCVVCCALQMFVFMALFSCRIYLFITSVAHVSESEPFRPNLRRLLDHIGRMWEDEANLHIKEP